MKYITLNNGIKMPMVGLGTWKLHGNSGKDSIIEALQIGYRLIDTAQMYGNEEIVGEAIKESKINREDIFITTKLDQSSAGYQEAKKGIERSLKALQTDYIDLLLIHEPYQEALAMYEAMKEAYQLLVDDIGEEAALAQIRESVRRINKPLFEIGLFDNPYVDTAKTAETVKSEAAVALGEEATLKSIVMLKNENEAIKASEGEKATAYIPMQFADGEWKLPVDLKTANEYYNVVTDTVGEPTGEAGEDGKATYTENDIIRATADELAECTVALVVVNNPQNVTGGYDADTDTYLPISLQYGEYVADSEGVRAESIAGDSETVEVNNPYVKQTQSVKENRSYYGQKAEISNVSDLDGILYTAENMPEDAKIIVAVNANKSMIFSEFEDKVDAILIGFSIQNDKFLEVASGNYEPSGLLPMQMPANMETVESQYEDVPRDMECYVDAAGNTYDFAYGLNWSGVISDERTEKYDVEPLTVPENNPLTQE